MISIILTTYNGERFIAEQIDSILSQSYKDFRLFIFDDLSTDNTFAIISDYARRYPETVFVEQNAVNTGGAHHNFIRQIVRVRNDYVMLCDQDDVWMDDKIELTYERMLEMEQRHGKDTPVMVHTDLAVTDENLQMVSESYKTMANIDYSFNRLNNLVSMNIVTGCTIMYNRALAEHFTAVPDFMVMHDWWVSLVAATFGEIGSVEGQTVLYRQHEFNSVGAKNVLSLRYISYVLSHIGIMSGKLNDSYRQARSFLKIYSDQLNGVQLELLSAHAFMSRRSRIGKIVSLIRYNTFLCGFARKVAQIIVVLFG